MERRTLIRLASALIAALTPGCSACGEAPPEAPPEAPAQTASATVAARPPIPEMVLKAAEPAVPRGPRYISAEITSSLEGAVVSAAGAEVGPSLTQVVKRVLVWWLDVRRDLRPGDRLEVVYETFEDGTEPLAHAIWFTSNKFGETKAAVRLQPASSPFARWYTLDGEEVEKRLQNSPIRSYEQVTSLLNDGRRHKGVDFKAPVGTPILAPFDGRVERKNWSRRRNGNCLHLVDPRTGREAYLLHLDTIDKSVRPGMRVKAGQRLATSGNTGRSTAPHLHYQLEKRGKVLDPFRVHETWRARLAPEDQPAADAAWARAERMRARPM